MDVAHIDVRHDEATMDIRQGASLDSMMTAGHMLGIGVTAIMIMFLIIWVGIMKHILSKAVPKDWLAEWSKPLPKAQWATPSQAVTVLSKHLRAAYQRGEKFIEMGDIEKRFEVDVPKAPHASYPALPFRENARPV